MSEFYAYLSSRAGTNPVRTIFLFVPESCARTMDMVEQFAHESGWFDEVEREAALLIAPVAPKGWAQEPKDLPKQIYLENRRNFHVAEGKGIPGTHDTAWTWEVLLNIVGYAEGAEFASSFVAAYPGFAAASIFVDGCTSDYGALACPSDHWLVAQPVDYDLLNRDIAVAAWAMGSACDTASLFSSSVGDTFFRESIELKGSNPAIAKQGMAWFGEIIRWKNGPDGTLVHHITKTDFEEGASYIHGCAEGAGPEYPYALYLPCGLKSTEVTGLPLVLSLHGRGEPSYLWAEKNGWERLADETQAFAVLLIDSPGNIWDADRDGDALVSIVKELVATYGFDAERIYLTGFSNGAIFTCQMATAHPELFAAASPWNSPGQAAVAAGSQLGSYLYHEKLSSEGYEMPFWMAYGDSDDKAPYTVEDGFRAIADSNGCSQQPRCVWDGNNHYTADAGYAEGKRFNTALFCNAAGQNMASLTIMQNMPHGAIPDEARACWEFMCQFRRPNGSKKVEVINE